MARRTLAASVVVTISLAELACTQSGGVETRNPPQPGPQEPRVPADSGIVADDGGAEEPPNADGSDADGGPRTISSSVSLERRDDGTCVEVTSVDCPPGMACNPPPPREVPCPPDDKALPEPAMWANVDQRPDGTCWEHVEVTCPKGATCNPPPPRQVQCPPDKKLPEAKNSDRVTKRDNGECWESFTMKCPEGARCNPPPPRRVVCPADIDKAK